MKDEIKKMLQRFDDLTLIDAISVVVELEGKHREDHTDALNYEQRYPRDKFIANALLYGIIKKASRN